MQKFKAGPQNTEWLLFRGGRWLKFDFTLVLQNPLKLTEPKHVDSCHQESKFQPGVKFANSLFVRQPHKAILFKAQLKFSDSKFVFAKFWEILKNHLAPNSGKSFEVRSNFAKFISLF